MILLLLALFFPSVAQAENLTFGLAYSPLFYRQTNNPDYHEQGVALFGSYFVQNDDFEIRGDAYVTVAPVTQNEELNFRIFFGDIHGGWAFLSSQAFRISLLGGYFYSTAFGKGNTEGYNNFSGPETGLALTWYIDHGVAFISQAKYVFLRSENFGFDLANQSVRFSAVLKYGYELPIGVHLDAYFLNFTLGGSTVQARVYSTGITIEF